MTPRTCCVALLCVLLAGVLAAQDQRRGTSRIHGRIVAGDSGEPLAGAQVTIEPAAGGAASRTVAGVDGRFDVRDIAAGRYVLSAARAGYLTTTYREGAAVATVTVAERQAAGPVSLSLPRAAAITGVVVDALGAPVAQALVRAHRYRYADDGERSLSEAGVRDVTDDLGRFRVHGLPPGDFVVSANASPSGASLGLRHRDAAAEGVATYYPGTVNPAEALMLSLRGGEEVPVQIPIITARLSRILGNVYASDGAPAREMTVTLRPANGDAPARSVTASSIGEFVMIGVPPGEYEITSRGDRPGAVAEAASQPVSVTGEDILDLVVQTRPGATVRGTVTFDGTAPRPAQPRLLALDADGHGSALIQDTAAQGAVRADGSFELTGVTGRLLLDSGDAGWTVTSVALDAEQFADRPLDVSARHTIAGLRVTLSDRLTSVSGRVSAGGGRPLAGHLVVLLQAGTVAGRRPAVRTIRTDADGRFEARGLRPGAWVAGALADLEPGQHFSPDFQERLRTRGRGFALSAGESLVLELQPVAGLP